MQQPNIVLVTIDSLRADYIYSDAADTPTIDSLIEAGVAYNHAFAQGPFTTFSMPSLFTSRYPSGLSYVTFSDSTVGVAIEDEPTLPSVLKTAGYDTAGFHSNPLLSNLFGFDRGFDVFDANLPFSNTEWLPGRGKILTDKVVRLLRKHPYVPAETLTSRALDWLTGRRSDRPFFLWLHYMDVHGPYQAKSGFSYLNKFRGERIWRKAVTRPASVTEAERDQLRDLYRTEVEYTDSCLSTLLEGLKNNGYYEETTMVVTADHGEQFFEHGRYSHPHQLYDELTHVPLVFRGADGLTERAADMFELTDLTPTLIDIAGAKIPDGMVGNSLVGNSDRDYILGEANIRPEYTGCVRTEEWKYIRDGKESVEFLFDLEADPGEQTDVASQRVEQRSRLASILQSYLSSTERTIEDEASDETVDVDEEVKDRLEDLGYF